MMDRWHLLLTTSMAILALFVPLASAQEPSPAGGGFVSFVDGGFAVALDDEAFDEGMESFMIEAWIYLTERPERPAMTGTHGEVAHVQIIAAKPGSYELALTKGNSGHSRGTHYYLKLVAQNLCKLSAIGSSGRPGQEFLTLDRWHHIGIGFSGSPSTDVILFDGRASFWEGPTLWNKQTIFDSDSSLYIGGIADDKDGNFPGYIDEVRISDVLRYLDFDIADLPKHWQQEGDGFKSVLYDLPGRFESDEHTRGLWHFDEGEGETEFRDSSGNNNTLVGKEGAAISGAYAVEPLSKLTTTWGKIRLR